MTRGVAGQQNGATNVKRWLKYLFLLYLATINIPETQSQGDISTFGFGSLTNIAVFLAGIAAYRVIEESNDQCEDFPCGAGTCVNAPTAESDYACLCPSGFQFTLGTCTPDACAGVTCGNGGICVMRQGQTACHCPNGFFDNNLVCTPVPCTGVTCGNGGICVEQSGTTRCLCPDGFIADNLMCKAEPCAGVACDNGGICVEQDGERRCLCPNGFVANNLKCEAEPCAGVTCGNGGICVEQNGVKKCLCPKGFCDENLECKPDACNGVACENGGICVVQETTALCHCPVGFFNENLKCKKACPSGTVEYRNSQLQSRYCYYGVFSQQSWANSRSICSNLHDGGDLARIPDAGANTFISGNFFNFGNDQYWIGLNDQEKEGVFVHLRPTGPVDETVTTVFTNFVPGEPSGNNRDCVSVLPNQNFQWRARNCNQDIEALCSITLPT